ncbi:MAG: DUF2254 domain-containing protein [Jatrophihabitantaceae bacterium]
MRSAVAALRDTVRTQLWPLPVLGVLVAGAAGILLPRLDARFDARLPGWLDDLLFGGDAGAARTLLDAVASSLITVTSLTFSLTVVTLQLASSQFSPRLLRTFTSDQFVQATLGLFLATFTYSLTVLRAVRSSDEEGKTQFVPRIAVTVSFVLAVASVLGLVLFLAHLARQIRVETMLRNVHRDASATARVVLRPRPAGPGPAVVPRRPENVPVIPLLAPASGFLVRVDEDGLLEAARDGDVVLVLDRHQGDAVVSGTPLGRAWSTAGPPSPDACERLQEKVGRALVIGFERTGTQDIGYGLRQLTDVASKALSPGVNDPTTAVHALGHISALLCELADHDLGPRLLHDDDGRVRVAVRQPDLAALLEVALTQPRRYGASDPMVLRRMYRLLAELAWRAPADHHGAIVAHLERLRRTVVGQDFDTAEIAELRGAEREVREALNRRLPELTPAPTAPGREAGGA